MTEYFPVGDSSACPFCGSFEHIAFSDFIVGDTASRTGTCRKCNMTWEQEWILERIITNDDAGR